MKRLETFLTSPGQADPARQPLGRTVCWLENPRPTPFPLQQSSTRPGHLKSPCQPEQFVKFCLKMASMVESVPRNSTEQKSIKTMWLLPWPTACQKDGRWKSGSGKVDFSDESSVELHHSRHKYCRRPTGARMDPRFTQKTVKFGGGKIMAWGYIQYGGVREICRVEGNINSPKISRNLSCLLHSQP